MNIREALETAIKAEANARQRYLDMAAAAEDPESRLLFEQLAREEESHEKRLAERLKAFKLMDSI
ncbi:MAG: rubrerythrin [Syntrophomonadaceae bacterium]|nr:rubrerythrin [Syntrophomonadaceae bacterium]